MMYQHRFHSNSGLSLLELLVSMALIAVIAAGLAQSMGQGIRVWEVSKTVQARQEPIILRTALRSWIEQAVPPNRTLPYDNSFSGSNNEFTFLTLQATPYNSLSAAQRIHVFATTSSLNITISYLDDSGKQVSSTSRVLMDSTATISYFLEASDGGRWVSSWANDAELPRLVRIESTASNWPDFTVAPLLR